MNVGLICQRAKEASREFSFVKTSVKNKILFDLKSLLIKSADEIILANKLDLECAQKNGKNKAFLDRLMLNKQRILGIAEGLDAVVKLNDPVGEIVEEYNTQKGLGIKKIRAPLGVVGIIFEARPNVSVDAAALALKSGNGIILRGSKDSTNSVDFLVSLIKKAIEQNGLNHDLVGVISGSDRGLAIEMLKQDKFIDVIIPRGGESLKKTVLENATMPVLASSGGNCHLYVAKSANINMSTSVATNAKVSRPGVCNALETLLVDRSKDKDFIIKLLGSLKEKGVEIRGTEEVNSIFSLKVIDNDEFYTEYEDLIIKVKLVDGVEEAIAHINKYGTHHSDAILTEDKAEAESFTLKVDSAAVYVNASTRFTDGFELGLGAEMGISTQKLHVRGPIGLKELTSIKYVIIGDGTIR